MLHFPSAREWPISLFRRAIDSSAVQTLISCYSRLEADTLAYSKILLNGFNTLLKSRFPSNSRSIEQHTLKVTKPFNLIESLAQLVKIGHIARPRLDLAAVSAFLDGIEHRILVFAQAGGVPGHESNVGEASDGECFGDCYADTWAGAEDGECFSWHFDVVECD